MGTQDSCRFGRRYCAIFVTNVDYSRMSRGILFFWSRFVSRTCVCKLRQIGRAGIEIIFERQACIE